MDDDQAIRWRLKLARMRVLGSWVKCPCCGEWFWRGIETDKPCKACTERAERIIKEILEGSL